MRLNVPAAITPRLDGGGGRGGGGGGWGGGGLGLMGVEDGWSRET